VLIRTKTVKNTHVSHLEDEAMVRYSGCLCSPMTWMRPPTPYAMYSGDGLLRLFDAPEEGYELLNIVVSGHLVARVDYANVSLLLWSIPRRASSELERLAPTISPRRLRCQFTLGFWV
jgi:hypothetical protein